LSIRVSVVGAGVIGAAVARELSKYEDIEVHVVEREADVGWGVSKANTGIIHAGYDDDPEMYPLRAGLCRMGNELWRGIVAQLHIPALWCGSLVLAFDEQERRTLEELRERGVRNKVKGLKILDRGLCLELEPNLSDEILEGMWAPTAGVISPYEAVVALAENAVENGARLHLETTVKSICVKEGRVTGLETDNGFLRSDFVVNASGLFGDLLSKTAGVDDFSIRPRKGEYFLFDKDVSPKVDVTLFRVPKPTTKGVVVTQTADGNLLVGPNARDLSGHERDATNTTRDGLDEVWREATKMVSLLPPRHSAIRTFAGLRPEPDGGDFIIRTYDEPFGLLNCVGMRSPGLTSAPAVALKVVDMLRGLGVPLTLRAHWKASREPIVKFRELSTAEKDNLISSNPSYGKVVCSCELVTEAEVIEAIRRGAGTLDSIKFRTRAGMGRCQGSFCVPKLLALLCRETGKPVEEITLKGSGSELVKGRVGRELT
jgi:glycerol-3-phosphate dehydrogenase